MRIISGAYMVIYRIGDTKIPRHCQSRFIGTEQSPWGKGIGTHSPPGIARLAKPAEPILVGTRELPHFVEMVGK
ncbi:MAG: hypothetical protein A2Z77_07145 [Chloroflexi bacterium RBG_13_51_36]|nr:MAG: hypothetical protein A2Z77_07145 [Chloroflexi bacterium RBG_13_51_36]